MNESDSFNILLGDTYFHLEPRQFHDLNNNYKPEPIMAIENSGRFKGIQYSRRNTDQSHTSYRYGNASRKKDNS